MIVIWDKKIEKLLENLPQGWQQVLGFDPDCEKGGNIKPEPKIFVCGPCSSCMDIGWQLIHEDELNIWDSIFAYSQWQGRGQLRRKWISEPGNLFACLRLPRPDKKWNSLLSIIIGYCLINSLQEVGIKCELKWPNDILYHKRKLAGILIEEREDKILAGIGMNLISCPDKELLRHDQVLAAGCLGQDTSYFRAPFPLWARLASSCFLQYTNLISTCTPLDFIDLLEQFLFFKKNEEIRILRGDVSTAGIVKGLMPDGGLKVSVNNKSKILYSGSIMPLN